MTYTPRSPLTCNEFDALVPELLAQPGESALDDATRAHAQAHASNCARCAGLLADLTEIRGDAARLPILKPSHDLWNAISARIETPVIAYTARAAAQLRAARMRMAAAAVILIAVTATATWKIARSTGVNEPLGSAEIATVPAASAQPNAATAEPVTFRLAAAYDAEIETLRRRLAERPGGLDSATAHMVATNFRVIDDAISRVRFALDSAPANAMLSQQLARAYETKLNTLRHIAALQTD